MKLRLMIVPALLAFAIAAHAGGKTVKLYDDAQLNGTALKAGEYKVEVDAGGTVTFAQGKNVVAKAPGKIVDAEKSARDNTVVKRGNQIVKLQFRGSKSEIVISDNSGSAAGSK
jgi:hypothetical protein